MNQGGNAFSWLFRVCEARSCRVATGVWLAWIASALLVLAGCDLAAADSSSRGLLTRCDQP